MGFTVTVHVNGSRILVKALVTYFQIACHCLHLVPIFLKSSCFIHLNISSFFKQCTVLPPPYGNIF